MKLRQWRLENRYTLREFAALIGKKSGSTILTYELGIIPKLSTLKKIEEITKGKVKVKDFYSTEDSK